MRRGIASTNHAATLLQHSWYGTAVASTTYSFRACRLSWTHRFRTSSTVGSKARRYRKGLAVRANCQTAYCCSRRSPIDSRALDRDTVAGSIQQRSDAQGCGLMVSGGSVPILSANTRPTPTVRMRTRRRQSGLMMVCSDEGGAGGIVALLPPPLVDSGV